jgi:hypothetical protein
MMSPETAQDGTLRMHSRKPQALKDHAAKLHIAGASNRAIARELRVKPHTVPHMLADSELLRKYQSGLMQYVPQALEDMERLLQPGNGQSMEELGRNARWVLEKTQVGVTKSEQEISDKRIGFAGRTIEELDFFRRHGEWPESTEGCKRGY